MNVGCLLILNEMAKQRRMVQWFLGNRVTSELDRGLRHAQPVLEQPLQQQWMMMALDFHIPIPVLHKNM